LERLKKEHPEYMPQLLMVDGNGILHMRSFGQVKYPKKKELKTENYE
jgi:deoxyinosine 3'endonuclease (endonuclease V)